jgi:hypothetical protein
VSAAMRWATFFRLALSFDVSTRICERLFVHFVLPGTVWRDLLRTLCGKYAALHRSAQRGGQTCVPVQGRCDILPPVRTGSYALGICARRFQRALPPQGTTTRDSRPARFVALAIDRCRALPAMRIRLASGFAGVCEMYEGARACAGCVAVGRAHASCLVWSRPCLREQVQSAFHVLAG